MGKTITSRFLFKILDFTKNKIALKTDDDIINYVKEKSIKNKEEYSLPVIVNNLYDEVFIDDMKCYIFNKQKDPKKIIIYLHGGSFIDQPLPFHFIFLNKIAKRTKALIYMPIYPKIPVYTCSYAYQKILKLYEGILSSNRNSDLIIMGDSAGGGLALGFTQTLICKGLEIPRDLILISPWINLKMDNPMISLIEEYDPILSLKQLKVFGSLWGGNLKIDDPLVSPFYGNLDGMPPLTYFTGVNEIFYPDALLFKDKCLKNDVNIKFIEDKNMYHCYPLYPVKSGRRAVKQIVRIINKKSI